MQRVLTTVTLLGLLVATAAAFVITEHLKLIKSPLYGTLVSKYVSPDREATIKFRLRHPSRVTVAIVNSSGDTVDTIETGILYSAHGPHHVSWDGSTDAGTRAPDGTYSPWITLNGRRTFKLPNRIVLDTKPPKVLAAVRLKRVLLAGPGRSVAIRYSISKKAHVVVYLGSKQIVLGRKTREHDKIKWAGKVDRKPVPAGRYVLSIGAQDLAGNVTPPAGRMHVVVFVRYIELTPERITVRSGNGFRVHVETAARRFTWRLGQRHGSHRGKVLHLRAPTTAGTYRLVIAEDGQTATAAIQVRAK